MPEVGLERVDELVFALWSNNYSQRQSTVWAMGLGRWLTRWHWDPRGWVDDRYSQRLVWDPGIEGSIHDGLTQRQSITQWFIWDLGIGSQLCWATRMVHKFRLLKGKQSWGGSICNVPFSGVPYYMARMDFQSWAQIGNRCRIVSSVGPRAFGGVLRSLYEV